LTRGANIFIRAFVTNPFIRAIAKLAGGIVEARGGLYLRRTTRLDGDRKNHSAERLRATPYNDASRYSHQLRSWSLYRAASRGREGGPILSQRFRCGPRDRLCNLR